MRVRSALLAAALLAAVLPAGASVAAGPSCTRPVLVLSAMPLELNPLVARAAVDPRRTVHVDDRSFYVGRLSGVDVVLALTGIGPVNAARTATTAFEHFRCPFSAALFSGVAGSTAFIGDVVVPQRWTSDGGRSYQAASAGMYAVARRLRVPLSQDVPVGDAACLCPGADAPLPVHLPHRTQLRVGGSGETSDPFGGQAAPCVWGGGDVAGCEPCLATGDAARDAAAFAGAAPGFPALARGVLQPPPTTTTTAAAQDEETGAVAVVARRYGVPFLGVRGVSDGRGDPLGLPGFPVQFLVYRQLAGNNAAAVTTAFLRDWARAGRPV